MVDSLIADLSERILGRLRGAAVEGGLSMRPVRQQDLPILYEWSTAPDVASSWRFRGATPPFSAFVELLFSGVLAQFVGASDLTVG